MFDYMTVDEAAEKWNVSIQHVRVLCRKGEVAGALKKGAMWLIPSGSEHPIKERNRLYQFNGTKKKIFQSSIELFAERSFDTITLKDIADRAGIAQSAVYRHFESKQKILDTIYGYYSHYSIDERPDFGDLEALMRRGTLKDIFECVYYDFSQEHRELMVGCLKIIFQRMSTDEHAGEIFRNLILGSGFDFAERVFSKAIEFKKLPETDPRALSVFSNMVRLTLLLVWLANAEREMHEDLIKNQDRLLGMIIQALTVKDDGERC